MTARPQAVDVGMRRELFVDEFLIDRLQNATLRLHPPQPAEVVLACDRPWEGGTSAYFTVIHDPAAGLFRMYFRGSGWDFASKKETHPEVTCYAESDDGVNWRRPELGLQEFGGSRANNILLAAEGTHNFAPLLDTAPTCAVAARYKALSLARGGLCLYTSPDGIHWAIATPNPVITREVFAFDSQNLAFWDRARGRYAAYYRVWTGYQGRNVHDVTTTGVRSVERAVSDDLLTWREPALLEFPGRPVEHLYTSQALPCPRAPHLIVGFPARFLENRTPSGNRVSGVSDSLFMSSRDGVTFKRWDEAFLRPGPRRYCWFSRNNYVAHGILETHTGILGMDTELSLYATEGYYETEATRLRRFVLRPDGFVSVQAAMSGGELLTKPLTFGRSAGPLCLYINYSTSAAGSVRCEIQDATGQPLPGFATADADVIYGDEIERAMSWQGRTDVAALAGQPVRLRFELKDADLYAMRFGPAQAE
ncbi:MAG: hypothetical protein A3K19_03135 [Lentisphaerae bacterium RIFOXYB12_FULL_65_16]|nr:MAG: hypothetical protein A3K18_23460 [Lentisphaerae bacterium RIFOXYA12_64_32]OGV92121.1 MAG: hypothetical protein A3K19_03135 [Lentisphaerae bacterium RIFOXYB12_FULL_65_16]